MKTIDVFIPAGDNAAGYAKLLKRNLTELSSGEFSLSFKCIINSRQFSEIDGWQTAHINKTNPTLAFKTIGSFRHGQSLNLIHRYIGSEYTLICDADVAVLRRNWDKELVNKID